VNRQAIYALIDSERERQAAKWSAEHRWGNGDCSSDAVQSIVKVAVLAEECGEVARAVLDHDHCGPLCGHLADELVQVAAVAVAWLESLDR
jgi:NTP pyrophosphatase (non-canonical NTP hydrolase)